MKATAEDRAARMQRRLRGFALDGIELRMIAVNIAVRDLVRSFLEGVRLPPHPNRYQKIALASGLLASYLAVDIAVRLLKGDKG